MKALSFIQKYFIELWSLTLEMAPWLLLGFLFSGLLKAFFPQDKIQQHLGDDSLSSIVKAILFGVPLPLCSCGVIPAGTSFYQNGASKSATNAFLISTPQTGVDSILATYALMGLPFAIIRPIIALSTGFLGGLVTRAIDPDKKETKIKCTSPQEEISLSEKWKEVFTYGFGTMVQDLAKWLVIGLLLATLISVLLPPDFFAQFIGNPWLELTVVLAFSIPLYVCATGSIPIAMVLLMKGISPGAAIVFLMAGPATNVATLTVLNKVLGRKSLLAYLFSIIGGALFFGILVNVFIPPSVFLDHLPQMQEHVHDSGNHWVSLFFGLILVVLILSALGRTYLFKNTVLMADANVQIQVDGMTCNHCKNNVETNLAKLNGVEEVAVDLDSKTVNIKGSIDVDLAKKTIENLGYHVID